jgi:hypothetical protein
MGKAPDFHWVQQSWKIWFFTFKKVKMPPPNPIAIGTEAAFF